MCGILALFSSQQISQTSFKQGLESLNHRGPDARRYWISPNERVALGHTRLSIIDLNGGSQPIANRDNSLQIIVNGEFYGFEQIQRDLRQLGYQLQTNSDSEIALHLYDEFGSNCLHHLRGEFAFVIYDEPNQSLFAARDRFGIKPLYYTIYQNTLYLASEIKALFAAGVPATWDSESFFLVNQGIRMPHRTLFANVHQVPPGHYLIANQSGIQLHQYWDFNYPQVSKSQPQLSFEDGVEQLRAKLSEAVRLRLRADVPVGCYLSGGLDSAAALGMASEHMPGGIQAFTIAFEQEAYNEEKIAREMAESVGANLQVIPITESDLAANFADAVFHGETLCVNAHSTAKYVLSQAVSQAGYKVVLTGEGADEIFAGYPHFRQDMLLHNSEGQDEQTIQKLLTELTQSNQISSGILLSEDEGNDAFRRVKQTLGFVPAWMGAVPKATFESFSFYSSEFVNQFARRDPYKMFLNHIDVRGQLTGREPVHQSLYLWSKTILPNYLLRLLGDGMEMAHSVEGRLPFLDHEVVELVRNLPVSSKIRGQTEKLALREATKPFITDTIYQRQKHPFLAPPSTFQPNGALHQLVQDTLRSSVMSSIPFYDRSKVIELLDELPNMSRKQLGATDAVLMPILSACILQEKFSVNTSTAV
jgi:asparagine synthase (glutamine-hydrolysing)